MTTLAKVFVVVLAVFSIAFSMLVIQYTAQSVNYRTLAQENRLWALKEQAERQALDNKQKIVVSHLNNIISSLQKQISEQKQTIDTLTNQLGDIKTELLAERQKSASLASQASQLTSMNNAGSAERKQLQAQLEQVRKDNAALRMDNIRLAKLNQKLELQRKLYEKEIRLLKEQNYALGQRMEELRAKLQAGATGQQPVTVSEQSAAVESAESSPVIGEITSVRDSLASISVGAAQGVKLGMEMIIYRGAQYLGKLKISKVLPSQAAGEIVQLNGNIRPGDKVTNKFQF